MQVMAVHAGGSLDQHTPDLVGHDGHSPGGDVFGEVRVTTQAGTRVASLVGPSLDVSCHHHQSVASHPGFTGSARAADGTLEAMEAPGDRFCVAVQWHPETAADVGLLAGLVRAASAFRG
jgi:putative glutamine amidotransferase